MSVELLSLRDIQSQAEEAEAEFSEGKLTEPEYLRVLKVLHAAKVLLSGKATPEDREALQL